MDQSPRPSRNGLRIMNGKERILAHLAGQPVDHLPLMPITMMFATDQIGVPYRDYATDHRVLVEAQLRTAERFGFDYVSVISDPAREAADCGAKVEDLPNQPPALVEAQARLADKSALAQLKAPDPLGGGRMTDRVQGVALFKEKVRGEKMIEGWIEGPVAEAADLRGINTLMLDFFDDPTFVRDLFEFIVGMELRFARAQITLASTSWASAMRRPRWSGRRFTKSWCGRTRRSWWTGCTKWAPR